MADELIREGARIMTLCNACRYCEGYCAVFPAMERRTVFSEGDLNYLANLCHNCGECYYACPYTPPHEYALNVPQTLARIRTQSYERYSWPSGMFGKGAWIAVAALVAGVVSTLFVSPAAGDFYVVIPHEVLALGFSAVAILVIVVLALGLARFWREVPRTSASKARFSLAHNSTAMREALSLKHMDRGARRLFHYATFYGFLLCFASTSVAAFYHYALNWRAPYPLTSLPVVLGTLGGIGLAVGTSGLFWMKQRQDPAIAESTGSTFIVLLWLTSVTGLALLGWRDTPAMAALLVIHLAVVLALFLTMPYGKFVHGMYRQAALDRSARESSS
jgi:citrate/tricarballylate utilization protein